MLKRVNPRAVNGTGRAGLTFGVLLCILCMSIQAITLVITLTPSDITGRYTFAGHLAAVMRDFDSINLLAVDNYPDRISGEIVVKRSGTGPLTYKLISTSISGDKLTFKTQIIGGINYRFEGRITMQRLPESEGGYDVPLLEGRLAKFRHGRKLGEIRGDFKYEEFAD